MLQESRLRADLSQSALAEFSGKDRVQIARYEAGCSLPITACLVSSGRRTRPAHPPQQPRPSDRHADAPPPILQWNPLDFRDESAYDTTQQVLPFAIAGSA
jgi:hypothetical protein